MGTRQQQIGTDGNGGGIDGNGGGTDGSETRSGERNRGAGNMVFYEITVQPFARLSFKLTSLIATYKNGYLQGYSGGPITQLAHSQWKCPDYCRRLGAAPM